MVVLVDIIIQVHNILAVVKILKWVVMAVMVALVVAVLPNLILVQVLQTTKKVCQLVVLQV